MANERSRIVLAADSRASWWVRDPASGYLTGAYSVKREAIHHAVGELRPVGGTVTIYTVDGSVEDTLDVPATTMRRAHER